MPSNQAHWKNYLRSFCLNWYFPLDFGLIQLHSILNVAADGAFIWRWWGKMILWHFIFSEKLQKYKANTYLFLSYQYYPLAVLLENKQRSYIIDLKTKLVHDEKKSDEMWSLTSSHGFRFSQGSRVSKEKPLWYNFLLNWLTLRENQWCSDEPKSIKKSKGLFLLHDKMRFLRLTIGIQRRNNNDFFLQSLSTPAHFKGGPTVTAHPRKLGSMQ